MITIPDVALAEKILDALGREAFSLGTNEPELLRPYKLGHTLAQIEAWQDMLNDNIDRHMGAPSTISAAGIALARQLYAEVFLNWELVENQWWPKKESIS